MVGTGRHPPGLRGSARRREISLTREMGRSDTFHGSAREVSPTPESPKLSNNQGTSHQLPAATSPAPGELRVIKRDGKVVAFEEAKIHNALSKAFVAVEGTSATASERVRQRIEQLADTVVGTFERRFPTGGTIHIEQIQDYVELALMRDEHHKVARAYVLYREDRARQRAEAEKRRPALVEPRLQYLRADGTRAPLEPEVLRKQVVEACQGLSDVSPDRVVEEALSSMYEDIPEDEVGNCLVMVARALIEEEPNYTFVSARLLLDTIRYLALKALRIEWLDKKQRRVSHSQMRSLYKVAFSPFIHRAIALDLLDPGMALFDLERLASEIEPDRDLQFAYLGLQTLFDRYLLHTDGVRIELPQAFFMRVAMGLALQEEQRDERAIEFYHTISSFDYMCSTPTLFNSGTQRSQLSSCYLSTVADDLDGIFGAVHDNAMLSKWAGGLGNDWTPVRAMGSYIKGTNGKSQGVIPFLKVVNDTAMAVNQGGKRKGAVCTYLETWHLDIEEFLKLRKNTGDERRRTHDMHTANWIPDLFMKRVCEGQDAEWTLFSPNDVADLHDLNGIEFERRYAEYESMTRTGEITHFRRVRAREMWHEMLRMLYETGHPWITFKDACNIRSPQQHAGVVHSSNLCTEITLNTSADEIAVCNLGSVNLARHLDAEGNLDHAKLKSTVRTAVRMLDNVIDINYYAVSEARTSNMRHRPVGLGIMGFQDALYRKRISYRTQEAVEFADETMEAVSYYAIDASTRLARERGQYPTFEGSLWSKGTLPIDSLNLLAEQRGSEFLEVDRTQRMDWQRVRDRIRKRGMRNSNVLAIAPTATIANIVGVTPSIEPTYQNLFVKSNLSGEFTVVNRALVKDLKKLGLWDQVMVSDLKYFDGSLERIDRVPEELKHLYATAFEVEPKWLVESASRRQKWIDQSQSLNIYISDASLNKLDVTYQIAWLRGLKTTYYLRALGATGTEKSTLSGARTEKAGSSRPPSDAPPGASSQGLAAPAEIPTACSLIDPSCAACE